jgi:uncharacterized protein (TIGR03437 family)
MNRATLSVLLLAGALLLSSQYSDSPFGGGGGETKKCRDEINDLICRVVTGKSSGLPSVPLQLEANLGQSDPQYPFLARGAGFFGFLSAGEVSVQVGDRVLRAALVGASETALAEGLEPRPGRLNYFVGSDPSGWVHDVPIYQRVRFSGVYPGIDLVHYERQGELEHDFVVAPGAEPGRIRLRFDGADRMRRNEAGDLLFEMGGKTLRWSAPLLYQGSQRVEGTYVVHAGGEIGFRVGAYDRRQTLVIDPVISVLGYFGRAGAEVGGRSVVDAQGNLYLTGATTDALYPVSPGAPPAAGGLSNVFVTKLSADGKQMVYSTILGGDGAEIGIGAAIDAAGNAYIAGGTNSTNFPTTPGALRRTQPGSILGGDAGNCFVAKLNASGGALLYSTYLGGTQSESCTAIAVDAQGGAYVTGGTLSNDFPTTADVFQSRFRLPQASPGFDVFVSKLNPAGSALVFSTYVGGTGTDVPNGIAIDATGIYVCGITNSASNWPLTQGAYRTTYGGQGGNPQLYPIGDGFVFKMRPDGSGLIYSTFLGGNSDDAAIAIAVDAQGNAYVAGNTQSPDFPVTAGAAQRTWRGGGGQVDPGVGAGDGFLVKLNPAGTQAIYATLVGGSADDRPLSIALAPDGTVWTVGNTLSTDFPVTPDAPQLTNRSVGESGDLRAGDGFVSQFSVDGSRILFSTYLGGKAGDGLTGVSVLPGGSVVVSGTTGSDDLPVTGGPVQPTYFGTPDSATPFGDLFYARLNEGRTPVVTVAGVVNAASYAGGGVSPGMIVTLAGTGLGPDALAGAVLVNGALATTVAETRVTFDGVSAPIIYASGRQTSVVVPYAVAGKSSVPMVVEYKGGRSAPLPVPVVATGPGLFSANASGAGPGAFLNQNGSLNTAANPAAKGSVVILYGTGEGQTNPPGQDGRLVAAPLPSPVAGVQVTIGGVRAEVLYAGGAPGLTPGLLQLNVRVPAEVQAGAQPVVVRVGNNESQRGITVAIRN